MNKIEKHYNNYYKTKSLSHRILANRDVAERLQKSCAQYKISKIIGEHTCEGKSKNKGSGFTD